MLASADTQEHGTKYKSCRSRRRTGAQDARRPAWKHCVLQQHVVVVASLRPRLDCSRGRPWLDSRAAHRYRPEL